MCSLSLVLLSMRGKSPSIFHRLWSCVTPQLPGPAGVERPQALGVLLQQGLLAVRVHSHPQLPCLLPLLPFLFGHRTLGFHWCRWLEFCLGGGVTICIRFQHFLLFLFQPLLLPQPFLLFLFLLLFINFRWFNIAFRVAFTSL